MPWAGHHVSQKRLQGRPGACPRHTSHGHSRLCEGKLGGDSGWRSLHLACGPLPLWPQGQTHARCPLAPTQPCQQELQSELMGRDAVRRDFVERLPGDHRLFWRTRVLFKTGKKDPEGESETTRLPPCVRASSPSHWAARPLLQGLPRGLGAQAHRRATGTELEPQRLTRRLLDLGEFAFPGVGGFCLLLLCSVGRRVVRH